MIQRIHHVGIVVADLASAEAFATQVLGLSVTKRASLPEESTELVFLACGSAEIELVGISDPERRRARLELTAGEAVLEHIAAEVESVQRTAADWSASGVRFRAGAHRGDESLEPLELARTRSLFTFPRTSAGVTWQLIEEVR